MALDAAFLEAFISGVVAAFGLIWGSYLNVVVYRLPKGLSTAVPSSHCPRCSSRIGPLQNVPILSWVLLGARCSRCHGAISARYPLVEAAVAAIFLLGLHRFDEPIAILVSWILGCVLLALALIDYDRRLVPVVLTLPFGILAWAVQPFLGWATPRDAVATSILAAVVLLALSAAWDRMSRRPEAADRALGLGDAYAMFLIGACFGLEPTLRIVLYALVGAVAVLAASRILTIVLRHLGRRIVPPTSLPLVTFLVLAALWVLLLDPNGPI